MKIMSSITIFEIERTDLVKYFLQTFTMHPHFILYFLRFVYFFFSPIHFSFRFICEKDCEKYHHYRQQVIDCRQEKLKEQQKREEAEKEIEKRTNSGGSKKPICSMEEDKYDPESVISADNDSDDEYRRGMMDRNRDNIKRRIECRNELSEEERQEREAEERDAQRKLEKKKLRKSRWGGKVENANSSASTSSKFLINRNAKIEADRNIIYK